MARKPLPGKTPSPRRALWLAAAVGLGLLAYWNSFAGPFLMDNREIILNDSRIRTASAEHLARILAGPYWEVKLAGLYRPLVNVSFLFNYAVLGNAADPFGYHAVNFLIHAANIALVFALASMMFETALPAFLVAALWGVHPVLTESVTNLVGRADLLAAFGVLGSLYAYARALRVSGRPRVLWFCAAALAAAVGIFSKESAVVAIAVLFLYDLAFRPAAPWRARLPGYAAVAVPALIFLAVRARVLGALPVSPISFTDNPTVAAGFWISRLTAFKVIGYQIALLVWPHRLSADYSYNQIPLASAGDVQGLLVLLLCLAAGVFAFWVRRRDGRLFFGIGLFFVALSPTSNLVIRIGSIMAERFLYLPSIGVVVCAVCALEAVWRMPRYRRAVEYAAIVLLLAAIGRTWARNLDWADERRFWLSAVEAAPGSYKPHMVLATMAPLDNPAAWDAAAAEAARSLAILAPLPDLRDVGSTWRDAGVLYRNIGDRAAAAHLDPAPWYRKSLDVLLRSEAIELAHDAVERRDAQAHGGPVVTRVPAALYLELGRTYERVGDPARALAAFERGRALESDPNLLEELAALYRKAGNPHAAAAALVEALAVDGSRTRLGGPLVELYGAADPFGCSVTRSAAGPELNLGCPLVHGDICRASGHVAASYLQHGQAAEAASIRRTALTELGCSPDLLN